ncbi:MAG: GGDEF domain-containing protein [Clostridiales bacterium]|nr:GGDEF domain-containing protein [Clostridiales bacterium]
MKPNIDKNIENIDSTDIRNKAFYYISIITSVVPVMCIIGNIISNYPMSENIKWLYLLFVSVLSIIGSKTAYKFYLQMFLTLNIILIILPLGWLSSGRVNSNSTAYLLLIMIGIILLYEGKLRKVLLFILAAIVVILLCVEYRYPEVIQMYDYEIMFMDRLIQLPITLAGGYLILTLYSGTYIREREKLNEYSVRLKAANEKLAYLAGKDVLTDISNRRIFDMKLGEIIESKEHLHREVYIVLFDVDLFKEINDTYGHSAGDRVLSEIARGMGTVLNEESLLSRWGGDEFAIIYYGSEEEVINAVDRLKERLKGIRLDNDEEVTVSIGITKILGTDTMSKVFKRVDEGMYKAKMEGRNKYCII